MAVAANKNDMYEYEEVSEEEGKAFAKQYNAIFQKTTCKDSNGSIDVLFEKIGKQFLNPKKYNITEEEARKRGHTLDEQRNQVNKKKGCC